MHSHYLVPLLSGLAACQRLAHAAPVGETDLSSSVNEVTVTETTTFTLIREVPMSTSSGLDLSRLPVAAVTGEAASTRQEGTTIVSPDVDATSLPPPAVFTSEFSAVLPEDVVPPSASATSVIGASLALTVDENGGVGYPVSQNSSIPTATGQESSVVASSTSGAYQSQEASTQTDTTSSGAAPEVTSDQGAVTGTSTVEASTATSGIASSATDVYPVSSTLESGVSILPNTTSTSTASAGLPDPSSTAGVASGCNATAPGTAGQGKAGLGCMDDSGDCAADFLQAGSRVSWGWNWSPKRDLVPDVLDFVPILFGGDNDTVNGFRAAEQEWGFGVSSVMSLYEPHLGERANITAERAATIHKEVMNVMNGVYKIGGPVMSQDSTGSIEVAKKWYTDLYVACERNCTIDFLPIAIYGTDITKSIGQITEWYNLFGASNGLPIWIVEMDCRDLSTVTGCPAEAAEAYARALMDWADSTEWVDRYAWFDVFVTAGSDHDNGNSLITSSGSLSALGHRYAYGLSA